MKIATHILEVHPTKYRRMLVEYDNIHVPNQQELSFVSVSIPKPPKTVPIHYTTFPKSPDF